MGDHVSSALKDIIEMMIIFALDAIRAAQSTAQALGVTNVLFAIVCMLKKKKINALVCPLIIHLGITILLSCVTSALTPSVYIVIRQMGNV
jgi:hypothetical protein